MYNSRSSEIQKVFIELVTRCSLLALTVDSSRRSLTMMSMLCLKRACQFPKRCVPRRTNRAGTAIISQTAKRAFSQWWPKLRRSWRVSDGSFDQCRMHMHLWRNASLFMCEMNYFSACVPLQIFPDARSGTSSHRASTWWLDYDIP